MEIYQVNGSAQAQTQPVNQEPEMTQEEAMGIFENLKGFFQSGQFAQQCNTASKKTGIPAKQIAKGFITKILGTIGDILGIGINVVRSFGNGIIEIITAIAKGAVNVVCNVAQGIASIVTFNQTACTG